MKPLLVMAAATLAAFAQDVKHLTVAPLGGSGSGPVSVSARSIERGPEYPSVIRLKGDVEIRTPVCFPTGKGAGTVCYGETIVRAGEAEYDERTGEVKAHGNVTVIPLAQKK